jgi:hypothetical protein
VRRRKLGCCSRTWIVALIGLNPGKLDAGQADQIAGSLILGIVPVIGFWGYVAHAATFALCSGFNITCKERKAKRNVLHAVTSWSVAQDGCSKSALDVGDATDGQRTVFCESDKLDKYRRHLARCAISGEDPAEWMAGQGWAVPYRDCKCETVRNASEFAHNQHAGIWSGTFMMPWEWRRAH